MAYAAFPLTGWAFEARVRYSVDKLLRSPDPDQADATAFQNWFFQPNTDATAAVTLGSVTVSASTSVAAAPTAAITVTLDSATVSAVATLPPAGSISVTLESVSVDAYATRGPWPAEKHVLIGGALSGLNVNVRRKIVVSVAGKLAPADALTLEDGSWLLFDDGSYLAAEAA